MRTWKKGLLKTLDALNYRLLLFILKGYDLQPTALKQMENYLPGRFQRRKVSNSYSSCSEIIAGVPEGSILGPLLFNTFLNDLFFNICFNIFLYHLIFFFGKFLAETFWRNYAENNILYSIDNIIESLKKTLNNNFRVNENWFHEKLMRRNAIECV